jgi:pimeloyl-ACP methyl ester carboxylesterase
MKKLLLLHGALGSAADFNSLLPYFEPHYNCFAPDLAGHGQRSDENHPYSIPHFAEQLARYVEAHELHQCLVFGYSMGGYVAAYLEHLKPSFSKIYTLGTKFIWNTNDSVKEASMLNPAMIQEKVPTYAAGLAQKHGHDHWRAVLARTADMMLALGQKAALSPEQLGQLQLPMALGWGDRDKMIPLSDVHTIQQSLPQACLDVLPYTPHPLDKVNPQLLLGRLQYFFDLSISIKINQS